ALVRTLIEHVDRKANISVIFGQRLLAIDPESRLMTFDRPEAGTGHHIRAKIVLAADGTHSSAGPYLLKDRSLEHRVSYARHCYKELKIPVGVLEPGWTHVWPRGEIMLVAFPNPDESFTATLFMPFDGPTSFLSIETMEGLRGLFDTLFPDVAASIE